MRPYFTRDRFGRPQFLAGLLLLAFLGQALWLVRMELAIKDKSPFNGSEAVRITAGWRQWHGLGIAGAPYPSADGSWINDLSESGFDTEHSPLLSIATAAPLLLWPERWLNEDSSNYWRWLPRLPFLACGLFLGASLWYVARRLCGNTGGFIALTLYCFSPSLIQASAVWHAEPEIVAAWGTFGTIFTAIAVAHTLYAPREVVLWNWRRILLLGIALAIGIGSQFSLIIVVPLALAFLLYVAPVRRQAGFAIWAAACLVSASLLFAIYFFRPHVFVQSMKQAAFWGATWRGFTFLSVYKQVVSQVIRACPVLVLILPVAGLVYLAWPRTRYFGNTAPLLMAVLFILLAIGHPHVAGEGFLIPAIPFIFLFVSGVLADLLETKYRPVISACVLALLATYIIRTLVALAQVQQG